MNVRLLTCLLVLLALPWSSQGFESLTEFLESRGDVAFFHNFLKESTFPLAQYEEQNQPVTYFVPTNKAIELALGTLGYRSLSDFTDNTVKVSYFVNYHIISERLLSSTLENGLYYGTVASDLLTVQVDKSRGQVGVLALYSGALVLEADIGVGNNGVVHIIDAVLFPSDPQIDKEVNEAQLKLGYKVPSFDTFEEFVSNIPSLSQFKQISQEADVLPALVAPNYKGTIFIPSNLAFQRLSAKLRLRNLDPLLKDQQLIQDILSTHNLHDGFLLYQLENDKEMENVVGDIISIGPFPDLTVVSEGATARILDFNIKAGLVYIYVIDEVLLPWKITDEFLEKVQDLAKDS